MFRKYIYWHLNISDMNTKAFGIAAFSLFAGAALFADDKNIGADALWNTEGSVGGQTYTSEDKIHIRSVLPDAVPVVTFDFGADGSTSVAAIVLGYFSNPDGSAAGVLDMESGTLDAGGVVVGIPNYGGGDPSPRQSLFKMAAGTELVISGKDDANQDYNGLYIARQQGTFTPDFNSKGRVEMDGAKLTFTSALENRTTILSVGGATNSIGEFYASNGSVIRQDTSLSGANVMSVRIAEGESSTGTVTLDGAGTLFDISTGGAIQGDQGFVVGYSKNSTGVVNVQNGAGISQSASAAGTTRIIVARGESANGTLNVDGAGSFLDFSAMQQADVFQVATGANSVGTVNIKNGGKIYNEASGNTDMRIGMGNGAKGYLNVTGAGSSLLLTGTGRLKIGSGGGASGEVLIKDGGRIEVAAKAVAIGDGAGGTGVLTVDNASYVSNFANSPDIAIGNIRGSTGTMNVINGASVSNGQGNLTLYVGGAYDSRNDSSGTVALLNVRGQGTSVSLINSSNIVVGYGKGSRGTFNLSDKASVSAGMMAISGAADSYGEFNMSGASTLSVSSFIMGANQISSPAGTGYSAVAKISGVGTQVSAGNMQIGNNSTTNTGLVSIGMGDGARVAVSGTLSLNYDSDLAFILGQNDLSGSADAILKTNNLSLGDSVSIVVDGSSLGVVGHEEDFQVYLFEYSGNAPAKSAIEAVFSTSGFDSDAWNVGAFAWDGNKLFLNISSTAVPEPGAYAALFGAIALMLAACRGRGRA